MAKRIKKPPVRLEQRQDWLRRSESGESVPHIADSDGYDVRTVRRHIRKAKEERELKEARVAVVRSALEDHYRDIIGFVDELDAQIKAETPVSPSLLEGPMCKALREHQPRAPLWGYLVEWDNLQNTVKSLHETIISRLREKMSTDDRPRNLSNYQREALVSGTIAALLSQMRQWAQGEKGLALNEDFRTEPREDQVAEVVYGSFHMGDQGEAEVENLKVLIGDLEDWLKSLQNYGEFSKVLNKLLRTKGKILEELEVLRYRRIVPGHCKYCPL